MISTGLSATDQKAYIRGLLGNHSLRIRLQIMTLEHDILADISDYLLDGQVNVDGEGDTSRSLTLQLFDPEHSLSFDTNSPADGALYLDRMIRVWYGVKSYEHLDEWVEVPIFTGPISSVSRDNAVINIEAMGKEIIAKGPIFRTINFKAGSLRSSIIRQLMVLTGEDHFTISDDVTKRTIKAYGLTMETEVWALVKHLAGGYWCYYDGGGYLVLREWTSRSLFTFSDGDGGSLLSVPQISYTTDETKNAIYVKGTKTVNGKESALTYLALPNKGHPMSPFSLGRHDRPRYLAEVIEDSNLRTPAEVRERARTRLAEALLSGISVTADVRPLPFFDYGDVVSVKTGDTSMTFKLGQFSIPLKAGGSMSIGYNKRVAVKKRRRTSR